jgi:hypothetical protein
MKKDILRLVKQPIFLSESAIPFEKATMEMKMLESFPQEKQIKTKLENGSSDTLMVDYSKAKNGKPLIKSPMDINIPIYLEEDLRQYFFGYSKENNLDHSDYINGLLRKIMDKKEF